MEVYKLERTLSIVKPDGVTKNLIGEVLGRFEKKGLKIIALKMVKLSKAEAEGFYAIHRGKPFFTSLGVNPFSQALLNLCPLVPVFQW